MKSQVVGWIEIDKAGGAFDWKRHPVMSRLHQHRLAGLSSRLSAISEVCITECVDADFEQLQADLEAEFEQLRKLAG